MSHPRLNVFPCSLEKQTQIKQMYFLVHTLILLLGTHVDAYQDTMTKIEDMTALASFL